MAGNTVKYEEKFMEGHHSMPPPSTVAMTTAMVSTTASTSDLRQQHQPPQLVPVKPFIHVIPEEDDSHRWLDEILATVDDILKAEDFTRCTSETDYGSVRIDESQSIIELVCGLILDCRTHSYPLTAIQDSYLRNKHIFVLDSEPAPDHDMMVQKENLIKESGGPPGRNKCLQLTNALIEIKDMSLKKSRRYTVEELTLQFNATEDFECVKSYYDSV